MQIYNYLDPRMGVSSVCLILPHFPELCFPDRVELQDVPECMAAKPELSLIVPLVGNKDPNVGVVSPFVHPLHFMVRVFGRAQEK